MRNYTQPRKIYVRVCVWSMPDRLSVMPLVQGFSTVFTSTDLQWICQIYLHTTMARLEIIIIISSPYQVQYSSRNVSSLVLFYICLVRKRTAEIERESVGIFSAVVLRPSPLTPFYPQIPIPSKGYEYQIFKNACTSRIEDLGLDI